MVGVDDSGAKIRKAEEKEEKEKKIESTNKDPVSEEPKKTVVIAPEEEKVAPSAELVNETAALAAPDGADAPLKAMDPYSSVEEEEKLDSKASKGCTEDCCMSCIIL